MIPSMLEDKADRLESFVKSKLIEGHGLVLSFVDSATGKPFRADEFGPAVDRMRHPPALNTEDFGSYFAYENCGMATGAWLASQVCRYVVTGDEEALASARSAAAALFALYEKSQLVADGFFSKFHEGKISREISSDQCVYAMWALDRYSALASADEKTAIARMAGGMARFWWDRGYKHPYRERDFEWQWPLNRFPPLLWMAWTHTGDGKFLEEYHRLARLPEVRELPPFQQSTRALWRSSQPDGEAHWPFKAANAGQGGLSLEPLLCLNAPHRDLWLSQLEETLVSALPDVRADGLGRGHFVYREDTGEIHDVEVPRHASGHPNPVWEAKYYISSARTGAMPCLYARALMAGECHLPSLGLAEKAWEILGKIDLPDMREKIDPLGHLPDNQKWMTRCLSGDAVVNWIWAYWLGQQQLHPRS